MVTKLVGSNKNSSKENAVKDVIVLIGLNMARSSNVTIKGRPFWDCITGKSIMIDLGKRFNGNRKHVECELKDLPSYIGTSALSHSHCLAILLFRHWQ